MSYKGSWKNLNGINDRFSKMKLPIERFPLNIMCTIYDSLEPFRNAIKKIFKGKPKNNKQNNS